MTVKHLIVDANNLLFRAYFVTALTDKKGNRTSGIHGTMRMLPPLMRMFKPKFVTVAWDVGKSKERLALYPAYKAQRDAKRKPEDVAAIQYNREACQRIFSMLPVRQIAVDGLEADDVIEYLCERLKGTKVIVSNDSDFFQVVRDDVHVYMPNKETLVTPKNVDKILGFPAKHYVLWKCMVGDTSDNIKGLPGIGPKRATAIITNGLGGGKKPKLPPDQMKILQRNKDLITMGALLQPHQLRAIRQAYRAEKVKQVDFDAVKKLFARHAFDQLFFGFNDWRYPFERLMVKK